MRHVTTLLCAGLLALLPACSKTDKQLAPAASALSSAKPVSEVSTAFALDEDKSGVNFTMEAELEKISGRAPGSARGELFVNLMNIEKTTGLLRVDLDKLSIYKQSRDDSEGEYGEEQKHEKQNKDMRVWFQISDDAPKEQREKFRWVEFKISKVTGASTRDVTKLSGNERKVTAQVSGDFLLHGRKTQKTIDAELVFSFVGEQPKGLAIKTKKPFDVGLEEHDVHPRKAFDQLADKTLDALGAKVAKVAKVEIDATASVKLGSPEG